MLTLYILNTTYLPENFQDSATCTPSVLTLDNSSNRTMPLPSSLWLALKIKTACAISVRAPSALVIKYFSLIVTLKLSSREEKN